ncbi:MAG TPA: hypothetical protein VG477_20615 [Thermoanaerobaculia bacterium]|nr:hypothetical protein [Thermoanaerobaculia bacterium]
MLVVFLLSIALGLLAASLQLRMRLVKDDAETVILTALSDAALAEAVANLAQSSFYSGTNEHPFGDGMIESRVEQTGPNLFLVRAIATYDGRKRDVAAEVVRAPGVTRVRRWRLMSGSRE